MVEMVNFVRDIFAMILKNWDFYITMEISNFSRNKDKQVTFNIH